MANDWQERLSLNEPEFEAMASVLEGRHGLLAAEGADFFSAFHYQSGDEERSHVWADVAERVRDRERNRLLA